MTLDARRAKLDGPTQSEAWFEADHENGLTYAARLIGEGENVIIGEIRIFSTQPDRLPAWTDILGRSHGERPRRGGEVVDPERVHSSGGMTVADFRKSQTDGFLEMARARLAEIREVPSPVVDNCFPWLTVPRRDGERPHRRDDRAVATVAATYAELVKSGHRSPLKRTAELHGYTAKGAEKVIAAARERGILTPTTAGRAGGTLTVRGQSLPDPEK